jgi:hypothetical protein
MFGIDAYCRILGRNSPKPDVHASTNPGTGTTLEGHDSARSF